MKQLLTALIVFFVLGLVIVAVIRGVTAIREARSTAPAAQESGTGGGGFVSSMRDTLWSPVSILTGSGSPSGALPFYVPQVKAPALSDSFSSEEEWRAFASSSDEISTTSDDGYFDMSSYFGPTTTDEAKHFGEPSKWRGKVRFVAEETSLGWYGEAQSTQYVTLQAATGIKDAISITGWTIQDMRTGQRLAIPHAVRVPRTGQTGKLQEIILSSAERAIVSTQTSPLGTSFKENICSGYLDQFQRFIPEFEDRCPLPVDEFDTAGLSDTLGETCRDFVGFMSQCEFYKGETPEDVSEACVSFVRDRFTYNGCVAAHQSSPGFLRPIWRIFLGKSASWQSSDTLRLLDKEGRTVDVITL